VSSVRRTWAALALALAAVIIAPATAAAAPGDLFFSEYVEGTSNNKALEIYNPGPNAIDLAAPTQAYGVQMYFNGATMPGLTINLQGTIPAGGTFVVAQSNADPAILAKAQQTNSAGWFNGDDAVALFKGSTNANVDVIGQIGVDPGTEWGTDLTSTADNTLRRKTSISAGDTNGTDAFDPALEWDGFATNTFDGLGAHSVGPDEPIVMTCGGTLTALEGVGAGRTVTATDADSTVTSIALTSVSPTPAAGSIARTSFTPAAADGGTASATITVDPATPVGSYTVTLDAANDDATPQSASCSFTVNVADVKTIGEVQGSVNDLVNPLTHVTPFNNQIVFVRGVVTQKSLARSNTGANQRGIFIQNTPAQADADANSSDGLFIFMGAFGDLLRNDGVPGNYVPQVGDEIVISGRANEFFNLTQLSSARLERFVSSMNVIEPFTAAPPDDLAAANRYWERREDMVGQVDQDSIVLDGLDVFDGTIDVELWTAPPTSEIAQRTNPYERRAFRDPHPLDNVPGVLFDDGNGYRVLLGGNGVKAAANNNLARLAPAHTFQTIANAPVGAVNFSFNKYRLEVTTQPELVDGVDPAANEPPVAAAPGEEYAISNYNVENLYDFRDDPFDGCDFVGNSGCPGVSPPFNYVPESEADYQEHLQNLAAQIAGPMHGPDLLLVQEAEDQDICAVAGGALTCGTTNNRDGQPDTLQELGLAIQAAGGPFYRAAYDRNGADDRGIVAAFLYRPDGVELLPASADDPVLGSSPEVEYRSAALSYNTDVQNPKALNAVLPADVDRSTGVDGGNVFTRAPEVGHFRVWRTAVGESVFQDIWAVSNHFSSTPDARVGQRTEQAGYNAALYRALATAEPDLRADLGGDLNTFPRPDDPLAPAGSSDQLGALYDAGLLAAFDRLVGEVPASAYGYVFLGQAQTLDHQFYSPTLEDELVQVRSSHINADWPAEFPGDGARGASDHDPLISRIALATTLERLTALLDYYAATGDVEAGNTYRQLRQHLEQAAEEPDSLEDQLQAFVNQVRAKSPKQVTPEAAAALVSEAGRLLES
jgi:uncharacterized protein